jgi:hypothetical protein
MLCKTCTVCKKAKPLEDYYNLKASKDGKSWRCKTCDKETTIRSRKERYLRSRVQQRNANRKAKYGITPEAFSNLWEKQEGKCAICKTGLSDGFCGNNVVNKAVIDHCHTTQKVRGLLCRLCNQGLGLFKDNKESLIAATDYLGKNADIH